MTLKHVLLFALPLMLAASALAQTAPTENDERELRATMLKVEDPAAPPLVWQEKDFFVVAKK